MPPQLFPPLSQHRQYEENPRSSGQIVFGVARQKGKLAKVKKLKNLTDHEAASRQNKTTMGASSYLRRFGVLPFGLRTRPRMHHRTGRLPGGIRLLYALWSPPPGLGPSRPHPTPQGRAGAAVDSKFGPAWNTPIAYRVGGLSRFWARLSHPLTSVCRTAARPPTLNLS